MVCVHLTFTAVVDPLALRGGVSTMLAWRSVVSWRSVSPGAGEAVLDHAARLGAGVPDRPVVAHLGVTVPPVDAALALVPVSFAAAHRGSAVVAVVGRHFAALRPARVPLAARLRVPFVARAPCA